VYNAFDITCVHNRDDDDARGVDNYSFDFYIIFNF